MPGMNRAQLAARSYWEQTGQRLPVLVLDVDRGEAWHCRPSKDGVYAKLLHRMEAWPEAALPDAEIDRLNGPMRRYIASGRHPLRDEGCAVRLEAFDSTLGAAVDQLCGAAAGVQLPFMGVLTIGRMSCYYPVEYRVRCMFSFAPLAPDRALQFMGLIRAPSELLGRAVTLEVLMRGQDGSVSRRSLRAAEKDTPLELLTGDPIPGLPLLLGVPGGEVRFRIDEKAHCVKLSGMELPESGVLIAIGLSVREGQLMCHLNSRALRSPAVLPIVPVATVVPG